LAPPGTVTSSATWLMQTPTPIRLGPYEILAHIGAGDGPKCRTDGDLTFPERAACQQEIGQAFLLRGVRWFWS
jgi:hypothetical protein